MNGDMFLTGDDADRAALLDDALNRAERYLNTWYTRSGVPPTAARTDAVLDAVTRNVLARHPMRGPVFPGLGALIDALESDDYAVPPQPRHILHDREAS